MSKMLIIDDSNIEARRAALALGRADRRRSHGLAMVGLAMLAASTITIDRALSREDEMVREMRKIDHDRLLAAKLKRERRALKKANHK